MTTEERFERIEHVTAGLAEQFRMEREENRPLWRDTQRQISYLGRKIADTNDAINRMAQEVVEMDKRLTNRIEALGERIDALVSGIG